MTSVQEETSHHKTASVDVTVSRKPGCVVELLVKSSADLAKNSYKKAIRSIAKEVSVPGFRKGKAPEALIEKNYQKPLDDRWQKEIADAAFKEAQAVAKVPLLNGNSRISFDMKSHDMAAGAEMTFVFETEPSVPAIDAKSLEVIDVKPEEMGEDKVSETIEQIRSFFGTWESVTDRAVQADDYATFDIYNLELDPPELSLSNVRFKAHKDNMAKWMLDLALGMKIGDEKEGVSTPDADAPEEYVKENPPKKVRIKLTAIQTLTLPALDDDFAKKVGAPSFAEMKQRLNTLLVNRAEKEAQEKMRDYIADELLAKYPFDLPASIVHKEVQFRIKQLTNDPNYQRKAKSMTEAERAETVENVKKHAENAIKLFYVCREICNKEKLSVTESDVIPQKINSPLDAMFVDRNEMYDYNNLSQEQQAMVLSRVMLRKAEDFIIEHAKKIEPPSHVHGEHCAHEGCDHSSHEKKSTAKTTAKKATKKATEASSEPTKKRAPKKADKE